MFHIPDYTHNLSLRLSQVLDEIGVNERIILKGRGLRLLDESIITLQNQFLDKNISAYIFGSQTESTTTRGLESDVDILYSQKDCNVVQDWSEWEPGVKKNLLMIQGENISPGYCMLQCLSDDAPLPCPGMHGSYSVRDRRGRVLLKNAFIHNAFHVPGVIHGPARSPQRQPFLQDTDHVVALPCKSWPLQANHWIRQQGFYGWPSESMKIYCSNTGCFVVGVGSKGSSTEELEWRVSTSLAERCLMFSLNVTQIRCYVLMKMILKDFISPQYPDSISSFICKTVLFRCVGSTQTDYWRDNNLIICLTFCLLTLYSCVLNKVCPHFIIPENNLLQGRLSSDTTPFLLEILKYVITSNGRALLEISCDELGRRLHTMSCRRYVIWLPDAYTSTSISGESFIGSAARIHRVANMLLSEENNNNHMHLQLSTYMLKLVKMYISSHGYERTACSSIATQLSKTLGSVLASTTMRHHKNVTLEAITWLSFGLNSDVASGKLKLTSVFYCLESAETTEMILKNTEECYDLRFVEPVCTCHLFERRLPKSSFNRLSFEQNDVQTLLKHSTAFCVIFLRCEINCCPQELRYEMYRSTRDDLAYRDRRDFWMNWAVVDSLSYLYFLQYKTFDRLRKHDDKQTALSNLARTIGKERNLGHRETAMNLLGQCLEQENRRIDALRCYLLSLQLRGRNNAAKLHICRLLSSMANH